LIWRVHATVCHIDRKVRTEQSAEAAVDALDIFVDLGGVIALGVRLLGHDENALRAEFNAKAASLAALINDVNDAVRDLDALSIKGLSPVCHGSSSILH
jgi:hypothetical protein